MSGATKSDDPKGSLFFSNSSGDKTPVIRSGLLIKSTWEGYEKTHYYHLQFFHPGSRGVVDR